LEQRQGIKSKLDGKYESLKEYQNFNKAQKVQQVNQKINEIETELKKGNPIKKERFGYNRNLSSVFDSKKEMSASTTALRKIVTHQPRP